MKIVLIGHLKQLFDEHEVILEENPSNVSKLLTLINEIKKDKNISINRENTLFFVNDVEISALEGLRTELEENDIITLVPITHGG
ncbi:MAG: MoaD/ThiS family protein [Nitrososphaeria archaeon]